MLKQDKPQESKEKKKDEIKENVRLIQNLKKAKDGLKEKIKPIQDPKKSKDDKSDEKEKNSNDVEDAEDEIEEEYDLLKNLAPLNTGIGPGFSNVIFSSQKFRKVPRLEETLKQVVLKEREDNEQDSKESKPKNKLNEFYSTEDKSANYTSNDNSKRDGLYTQKTDNKGDYDEFKMQNDKTKKEDEKEFRKSMGLSDLESIGASKYIQKEFDSSDYPKDKKDRETSYN